MCIGALISGPTLDIWFVFKSPQKPGICNGKSIANAIVQHQPERPWGLFSSLCPPSLLGDSQGVLINPLFVLLQWIAPGQSWRTNTHELSFWMPNPTPTHWVSLNNFHWSKQLFCNINKSAGLPHPWCGYEYVTAWKYHQETFHVQGSPT